MNNEIKRLVFKTLDNQYSISDGAIIDDDLNLPSMPSHISELYDMPYGETKKIIAEWASSKLPNDTLFKVIINEFYHYLIDSLGRIVYSSELWTKRQCCYTYNGNCVKVSDSENGLFMIEFDEITGNVKSKAKYNYETNAYQLCEIGSDEKI